MKIWRIILSTLVIFLAGIFTGAILVGRGMSLASRFERGRNPQAMGMPRNQAPGSIPNSGNFNPMNPRAGNPGSQMLNPWQSRTRELVKRMDRELSLTPEQRQRIEALVTQSQERTRELWRPIAPEMGKEMQHLRSEIREQLSPDQRDKFDQLARAKVNAERRGKAPGGGNPPGNSGLLPNEGNAENPKP